MPGLCRFDCHVKEDNLLSSSSSASVPSPSAFTVFAMLRNAIASAARPALSQAVSFLLDILVLFSEP